MRTDLDTLTGETVDLLQQMIRNQCVNDGRPESGQGRHAELLRNEIEGLGLDVELYEPLPGRTSLVTRYPGTDPTAPSLCLMGQHRCRARQSGRVASRSLRWRADHGR